MTSTEIELYEAQWSDAPYEERAAAVQTRRPRRQAVRYSAQKRRHDIPPGFCARGRARNTYRTSM